MSVIYIIMLALYGILFFLSRKEKAAPDPSSARIDNLFSKAAEYVVRRAEPISIKPGSVRTDSYIAQHDISRKKKLNILNPAIPAEKQMHDIRTDIAKKVLVIIFFGTVISLMICLSQIFGGIIEEGNIIQRNTYEGGGKDVELVAGIDGTEESISYTVGEREYTEKELDTLFETLSEKLPDLIKGDNGTLGSVRSDLNLVRRAEGYPFSVSWESSDYSVIDSDGKVTNEDRDIDDTVTLTAICTQGKRQRITSFAVHVLPRVLSEQEKMQMLLDEALRGADEKNRNDEYFKLPDKAGMRSVSWSEYRRDASSGVMILVLICAVVVMADVDVSTDRKLKARRTQLLKDYPGLVSKVTLYLSAGMSLRNVFFRMAEESGNAIRDGTEYLGDEIKLTCGELQSGVQEIKVYEDFAKRCGLRQYMRFGTLVTQNLKKGSSDLLRTLRQEADESLEERKNSAKELGEQASTKLLFPMMMMLVVVMVIIIVPAFMSFAG